MSARLIKVAASVTNYFVLPSNRLVSSIKRLLDVRTGAKILSTVFYASSLSYSEINRKQTVNQRSLMTSYLLNVFVQE